MHPGGAEQSRAPVFFFSVSVPGITWIYRCDKCDKLSHACNPLLCLQYLELARAQGLTEEGIIRASEVTGGEEGAGGGRGQCIAYTELCGGARVGSKFEVNRAAYAPLHLQNLFPIAYYGLRTSGRLGRYKVSAVEVILRCDVLQLGQRVQGSGNALCWQTVAR